MMVGEKERSVMLTRVKKPVTILSSIGRRGFTRQVLRTSEEDQVRDGWHLEGGWKCRMKESIGNGMERRRDGNTLRF